MTGQRIWCRSQWATYIYGPPIYCLPFSELPNNKAILKRLLYKKRLLGTFILSLFRRLRENREIFELRAESYLPVLRLRLLLQLRDLAVLLLNLIPLIGDGLLQHLDLLILFGLVLLHLSLEAPDLDLELVHWTDWQILRPGSAH